MSIGSRIKERRKEIGMSADVLGEKLGKDRSTIYRYEKGEIENLPLDIIEPIAKALNTTPQYLFGWNEELEANPEVFAEMHVEMAMDKDLNELYEYFKRLNPKQKQIVKDLARSLAESEV